MKAREHVPPLRPRRGHGVVLGQDDEVSRERHQAMETQRLACLEEHIARAAAGQRLFEPGAVPPPLLGDGEGHGRNTVACQFCEAPKRADQLRGGLCASCRRVAGPAAAQEDPRYVRCRGCRNLKTPEMLNGGQCRGCRESSQRKRKAG